MITSNTSAIATMRPGDGNLLAGNTPRISGAVPALVVIADRAHPLTEPVAQWLHQGLAVKRVQSQALPLLGGRSTRLVEDLTAHLQLSDVVEQRSPVEPVEILIGELELHPEQPCVGAHALRMTPRDPVMDVERRCQGEQHLRRCLRGWGLAAAELLLELADRSRAQREAESRRSFVREDERELEQRSERQQPAGERVEERDDDGRRKAHREPPQKEDPE